MTKLLFLGARNAARSLMAEAFARRRAGAAIEVTSAGLEPQAAHPRAVAAMREIGIEIAGGQPRGLDQAASDLDVVVIMDAEVSAKYPGLPGEPAVVRWRVSDPLSGPEGGSETAFRSARDEVQRRVDCLFESGYLDALVDAKRKSDVVVDNITEGIIAHDMRRRILVFNRAAEAITGYRREDVLNRDCRTVFPDGFCGGKCRFSCCEEPSFDTVEQSLDITTKSGERRRLAMTLKMMVDSRGQKIGILASFRDLTREHALARRLGEIQSFSGIIGRDEKMLEVYDLIRDVADSTVPVLIQGESGTGKELIAAAIHNEGPRASQLFVAVNCGALPEGLLESELFGHVRGAFTGAVRDKKGRFELADGGTIFLDEIGDITPAMQVKLLRVLQEGKFERVGSERTLQVSVRVISATNRKLEEEIATGRFREDLYYRLSVVPIYVPPLRERRNDIPLLAESILKRFLKEMGKGEKTLAPEVMDLMLSYEWPGNVREMQNWLQFALIKCKGSVIRPEHLPPSPLRAAAVPVHKPRRRRLSAELVTRALATAKGNKVAAARALGVSRATLYRFLGDEDPADQAQ